MAAGTSVVASPNPGAQEVLAEGKYGLIAKDTELGHQLNRLLSDEQLRRAYIEKGLIRAHEFSWEQVINKYENLYTQLRLRYYSKKTLI
jgi:glycosyltransferase involved in cell wall biosynthesis